MSTYRELIYMCKDLLKLKSDDSFYTNEHIVFLLDKFRVTLLEQKYSKQNKEISKYNYQKICLDLVPLNICMDNIVVSNNDIPNIIITSPRIYFNNKFTSMNVSYVSEERFNYVGNNKWLKNFIYYTIINNKLYIKSVNPNIQYLKNIELTAIFGDTQAAEELRCSEDETSCIVLDRVYPIEEELQSALVELVVKELSTGLYKPADDINNAKDDLSDLQSFIARNVKSNLQKQIDG